LGDGPRGLTLSGYTEGGGADVWDDGSTDVVGGCTYIYQCIGLWSMETSWDNGNLNRNYAASGCHNGVPYYKSNDYYFYRESGGTWVVNGRLDESTTGYVLCYNAGDDPTVCGNNMVYYASGRWLTDSDVWVYDCGNNAANFEFDDDCDNINLYGDTMCLTVGTSNNSLDISEESMWSLSTTCHNDMPMFEYMSGDMSYYLWFEEVTMFVDSNETTGQWVLSEGDTETSGIAFCSSWELTECTAGSWSVIDENDDILGFEIDEVMAIEQCAATRESEEDSSFSSGVIMAVVLSAVLMLAMFGGYLLYRRRVQYQIESTMKVKVQDYPDDENDGYGVMSTPRSGGAVDQEVEVAVDVNVPITTTMQ